MRRVQFDHVKARAFGHFRGPDEFCRHGIHILAGHGTGRVIAIGPRHSAGRDQRPIARRQRRVHRLPAHLRRPFAARVADLATDGGVGLGVDEIHQPLPCGLVFGRVQTRTARRDPPICRHARHLGINQPRTALGPFAVMDQVPVGRATVHRLVLRHGRHHDTIVQRQITQFQRREHRRTGRVVCACACLRHEPVFSIGQPFRIAFAQVFVADPLRPRQHRIVELHRVHVQITFDILEPFQRVARRRLQTQHLQTAGGFVVDKGLAQVRLVHHRLGQLGR